MGGGRVWPSWALRPILEKPGFAHLFTHLLEPTELQLDRQIHPFIDLGPGHSQKVGLAVPLRRCLRRDAKDSGGAEFSGISTTLGALGRMVSLGRIKEVQPPPWRTIPPSAVNLDLPHTQKALRSEVCRNLSNGQSNPFCWVGLSARAYTASSTHLMDGPYQIPVIVHESVCSFNKTHQPPATSQHYSFFLKCIWSVYDPVIRVLSTVTALY